MQECRQREDGLYAKVPVRDRYIPDATLVTKEFYFADSPFRGEPRTATAALVLRDAAEEAAPRHEGLGRC